MEYIALDAHKKYSFASVEAANGERLCEARVEHEPGCVRQFLGRWQPGSPVAVETVGNWYWIVGEIEDAGMVPKLVHARRAKLMLASGCKTDRLDARGMNKLQRSGTLPTVWIPPKELRDKRELYRTRMILAQQRTRLKNRVHATLNKHGLRVEGVSDVFARRSREALDECVQALPEHARYCVVLLLQQLESVQNAIADIECHMADAFAQTDEMQLLMSLPGVGQILGVLIRCEVGDVTRFPSASHLASYAGTVPRVHASGGKVRHGQLRDDVNRYLKWAFVEAANSVLLNRRRCPSRHVVRLYDRLLSHKGHQVAIGAVARHLAEATFWILSRRECYREPIRSVVSSMEGSTRYCHEPR